MKSIVIALCTLIGCVFAQNDSNLDVGGILGKRPGYGNGTHHVYDRQFDDQKPTKLLTNLKKGSDGYVLTLNAKSVFELKSEPANARQISLKYKLKWLSSEKYLVDIAFLKNDEVIIAIANIEYGYDFIKFKLVNGVYVPYVYATAICIDSLQEGSKNHAKEVGFNASGDFIIKKQDDGIDAYTIPSHPEHVLVNHKILNYSSAIQYDNGLPDHLRVE